MQSFKALFDFKVAAEIYHKLRKNGHEVYFAGGCVRDGLLGLEPRDFDLATSANPEQIEALFPKTLAVGKAFGTIVVVQDKAMIEVTTFREDGPSADARRPETVQWSSAELDAQRRDLTINALFWDLENDKVIDFVGGKKDLADRCLRLVGEPAQRLAEDHLRLLRVVRFVAQLGFQIDAKTLAALSQHHADVASVSSERKREEMTKLLTGAHADAALQVLESTGLAKIMWPGWVHPSKFIVKLAAGLSPEFCAWSQFFSQLFESDTNFTIENLEKQLKLWTFSRQMQQQMKIYFQWRSPDALNWGLGAGLEKLGAPEARLGLEHLALGKALALPRNLEKIWQTWNSWPESWRAQLPEHFLQAQEIRSLAEGALLGEVLRRCYWAQLEGVVKTREQALDWARNFLQSIPKGP